MKKLDLRKELRHLYHPPAKDVTLVKIPTFNFLMIDGAGDPNTSKGFQDAIQALFTLSYTLKFMVKKEKKIEYPVMALEGLWWSEDMSAFSLQQKDRWKWTVMMMQPKVVTKSMVKKAVKTVQAKKEIPAIDGVRFASFAEGLSAQIMHIGPFSTEGPTIEKVHTFARERGCELSGKHHEIYLSDVRRVRPEKMKTVIRQPVRKVNPPEMHG
jgi:hypothetical protein